MANTKTSVRAAVVESTFTVVVLHAVSFSTIFR